MVAGGRRLEPHAKRESLLPARNEWRSYSASPEVATRWKAKRCVDYLIGNLGEYVGTGHKVVNDHKIVKFKVADVDAQEQKWRQLKQTAKYSAEGTHAKEKWKHKAALDGNEEGMPDPEKGRHVEDMQEWVNKLWEDFTSRLDKSCFLHALRGEAHVQALPIGIDAPFTTAEDVLAAML